MDDKIEGWVQRAMDLADDYEGERAFRHDNRERLERHLRTTPEGYRLVPVEPDDEQIRRALAVVNPSIYGHSLRDPRNGPNLSANVEKDIATMLKQYSAMLAASQESGT